MPSASYTVEALAEQLSADWVKHPSQPEEVRIESLAGLESAHAGQAAFLANHKYAKHLPDTKASVVLLGPGDVEKCPTHALVVDNPELGFAKLGALFAPVLEHHAGVHPTAVVDDTASIGHDVSIAPHVVIGPRAKIGNHCVIGAGSVIGQDCVLEENVHLYPRVTLYHGVHLGKRCVVHSGAVLGSDGFGLANDRGRWIKIPQLGTVICEDDVELGANVTVDRGAIGDTRISQGVKIDNMVHIAHNVTIGEHTAMAAQVGIAGSTSIGKHCMIGGASGIVGHIKIGDQVHFTGMSMVTRSIDTPGVYSSSIPAKPNKVWQKNIARLQNLDEWIRRLMALERSR